MGQIATALVSVSDRTGLVDFARGLVANGVRIVASEGTQAFLEREGIECQSISQLTGRAKILGGLVKTLGAGIHAGILADRSNPAHLEELARLGYTKIDMVVVNFYSIPARAEHDLSFIDIGGPAMARAAAKNFRSCVVVPHPSWYERVFKELASTGGVGEDLRWTLATDSLRRTGMYDAVSLGAVGAALRPEDSAILIGMEKALALRYGENPHQAAGYFAPRSVPPPDVAKGELSYNNLLDVECCLDALREFTGMAAVVVKHGSPCGVAEDASGARALEGAYACDPLSAFGGVIGVNFPFGANCARFLEKRFVECIVAPGFPEEAMAVLSKKKARLVRAAPGAVPPMRLRSALGGMLVQSTDDMVLARDPECVAGAYPPRDVLEDLLFAWKVVKHVRSNAIVFAKSKCTLGIGVGQPSRVDAARFAIEKAAQAGHNLKGSVVASDGFFPFPDALELAVGAGAQAAIQPGGSKRDAEVIAAAERLGVAMLVTGTRHFRH
jgi:phosphoribosylaminoimidazolecarboxamide formyltransferase/IMP cyclohydrolase